MTQMRRAEVWLQWAVVVVPVLVAPALLFPRVEWMVLGLTVPAVWVGNCWCKKHFVASTPLNLLLFPLLTMVLVSLYATLDVEFSLAKVAGTLLGVFVFFGLVQFVDRGPRLWLGIGSLCFGGVVFALVSLVVTHWVTGYKIGFLAGLNQIFPVRFRGLPGLEEGFNPNPVGGTLVLFVPLLLVLALYLLRTRAAACTATATPSAGNLPAHRIGMTLLRGSAIVSIFLLGAVLLLSQSRSAWAGFGLALGFLLCVRFRWFRWGTLALVLVTVALLWLFQPGQETWGKFWKEMPLVGEIYLESRLEIWTKAIEGIQDFAFTGMGMNSFRKVVHVRYPLTTIKPNTDIASAHNHILQAALDLGIAGMVVYVAMWAAVARMLAMVGRWSGDPLKRLVAMGLGAGLLAQLVYQTTDAIPLGAKVGIFWWITLGLVVSMFILVEREGVFERRPGVREWVVLLMWVLFSLLSIWVVGKRPYFGLGIGVVGGVVLGYYAVESYLSKTTKIRTSFKEARDDTHWSVFKEISYD